MMNDKEAIMQAIIENPKDDELVSIYADYLEDEGDPLSNTFRALSVGKGFKFTKGLQKPDFDFLGRYSNHTMKLIFKEYYIGDHIFRLDIHIKTSILNMAASEISAIMAMAEGQYYN